MSVPPRSGSTRPSTNLAFDQAARLDRVGGRHRGALGHVLPAGENLHFGQGKAVIRCVAMGQPRYASDERTARRPAGNDKAGALSTRIGHVGRRLIDDHLRVRKIGLPAASTLKRTGNRNPGVSG